MPEFFHSLSDLDNIFFVASVESLANVSLILAIGQCITVSQRGGSHRNLPDS